jgi:hypothetical protein
MALIQLGSIVTDIKGSIGGVTFSRNRSGITAKAKLVGKKATTQKQQIELQNNNLLRQQWQALTLTQKQVWNDYASLHTKTNRYGKVKSLTGFNWFVSIQNAWFYMYGSYLLIPPAYSYPAFLPTFGVTVNPSGIFVQWSTPIDSGNLDIFIFTSSPTRATASLTRGLYRLTQKGVIDYSTSFFITTGWEAAHNIVWSDIATSGKFFINIQIFAISKTSGLTGTSITSLGEFTATGIGAMQIGSTFIVG